MPIKKPKYQLTRAMVEAAPGEQGLYALWEDEELVYVGRGKRPRTTAGSSRCVPRRAKSRLEEFLAQFGRLPRCNEDAA